MQAHTLTTANIQALIMAQASCACTVTKTTLAWHMGWLMQHYRSEHVPTSESEIEQLAKPKAGLGC